MRTAFVLHLFAGAGGSHLAGEVLGWRSAGSVEIDPYCRAVLRLHNPSEIIHDDIRTFTATHLAGKLDGICGGFPCQDISSAGKGAGITGERSGLWKEFARIIGESRPCWAFIENSPLLRSRGLEVVLEDLAALGYDAEWATYRASDVGAPHRRDRIWILAYDPQMFRDGGGIDGCEVSQSGDGGLSAGVQHPEQVPRDWRNSEQRRRGEVAGVGGSRTRDICKRAPCDEGGNSPQEPTAVAGWGVGGLYSEERAQLQRHGDWLSESQVGRVVDGLADPLLRWNRVNALAALGNGWVPQQAAEAFRQLSLRAGVTV